MKMPCMWTETQTLIYKCGSGDEENLRLKEYGCYMKSINIKFQKDIQKEQFMEAFSLFRNLKKRRLQKLCVEYLSETYIPLYSQQLIEVLKPSLSQRCHLREVDLSQTIIKEPAKIMNLLSSNHPQLEKLNIDTRASQYRYWIEPTIVLKLVQKCRNLVELGISVYSINDGVLLAFTEEDRTPLHRLYISYG